MNATANHSYGPTAQGWDYPYSCTSQSESSDYGDACDCAACSWTLRIVEVEA